MELFKKKRKEKSEKKGKKERRKEYENERERERERDSSMVSNIQTFRGKESIKRRRPIQDHIHQA
jgi:hypothetical protein